MSKKKPDNRYVQLKQDKDFSAAATKHIGLGAIVFMMILAYLIIVLINFAVKENVNYTIAEKGILSHSNTYKGLIIRNEHLILAEDTGTLKYFMPEGSRVSSHKNVFGVITDQAMVDLLDQQIEQANKNLSASDPIFDDSYNYLKNRIKNYVINQFDRPYSYTYDAKNQILNDITEIRNTIIFQQSAGQGNGLKVLEEQLQSNIVYGVAPSSGLVSYKIDGLEFINLDTFNESHLELVPEVQDNSAKTMITKDQPVSKIVDNYLWYIASEIDDECEKQLSLSDEAYMRINFTDRNLSLLVKKYALYRKDNKSYLILEVDRMVNRFLTDRFVNFEVTFENFEGVKIPESAVTTKTFAKIPAQYFTNLNGQNGVRRKVVLEDALGQESIEISEVSIYKRVEESVYVPIGPNLQVGDTLSYTDGVNLITEEFVIDETEELEGVYVINKGFARFKFINTLYRDENYRIVTDNLPYGVMIFDRIATEASVTEEYQIIN